MEISQRASRCVTSDKESKTPQRPERTPKDAFQIRKPKQQVSASSKFDETKSSVLINGANRGGKPIQSVLHSTHHASRHDKLDRTSGCRIRRKRMVRDRLEPNRLQEAQHKLGLMWHKRGYRKQGCYKQEPQAPCRPELASGRSPLLMALAPLLLQMAPGLAKADQS